MPVGSAITTEEHVIDSNKTATSASFITLSLFAINASRFLDSNDLMTIRIF